MRKELLVRNIIRNNIKLYAWLRRRNKSVSGDEVTTLSLFAAANKEKREERRQEIAQNFPKTLKIKFTSEHQDVLRVTTALHLGSREIGEGEGAKEIREEHA